MAAVGGQLDAKGIEAALTGLIGQGGPVQVRQEVGSTNDLVRELALSGAPDWTLVAAERQTVGRGRRGRDWASPAGLNLYASVLTAEVGDHQLVPCLPLVAAVAVAEALSAMGAKVALKWPNDLLAPDFSKLGGILVESGAGSPGRWVVGVGVNVNASPDDLPAGATSLRIQSGAPWDRNQLAARVIASLRTAWETLAREGFAPIQKGWLDYACWLGHQIVVTGDAGHWNGRMAGIDPWGRLRVATPEGERRFSAGDVSLRPADGVG